MDDPTATPAAVLAICPNNPGPEDTAPGAEALGAATGGAALPLLLRGAE